VDTSLFVVVHDNEQVDERMQRGGELDGVR
jgi:hypothetical protein